MSMTGYFTHFANWSKTKGLDEVTKCKYSNYIHAFRFNPTGYV